MRLNSLHSFGATGLNYLSRKSDIGTAEPDERFELPQIKALSFFLCTITLRRCDMCELRISSEVCDILIKF